ncbi:MAG: PASTA domain-containing protein [Bacteroidales bacterium]|nr:PASTA domain-containing protein [Bacteroidales bacterium]
MDSKSFFGNAIVRNLLGAAAFVLGIVIVASIVLRVITRHGKEITVPDFTAMSVQDAQELAQRTGLAVKVTDSVFVNRMEHGVVYYQNPKPESKVKNGRTISVTINALNTKKVTMPLLVGYSMRQAKSEILSKGLTVGKLIYVSDMATNNVLKQLYRNKPVEPGTMIESGSAIDLVVGLNGEDCHTFVPDLTGARYLRAIDAVLDNSLNVGKLRFDETVKTYNDTLNSFVYSQSPKPESGALTMGEKVSISFTLDASKLPSQE